MDIHIINVDGTHLKSIEIDFYAKCCDIYNIIAKENDYEIGFFDLLFEDDIIENSDINISETPLCCDSQLVLFVSNKALKKRDLELLGFRPIAEDFKRSNKLIDTLELFIDSGIECNSELFDATDYIDSLLNVFLNKNISPPPKALKSMLKYNINFFMKFFEKMKIKECIPGLLSDVKNKRCAKFIMKTITDNVCSEFCRNNNDDIINHGNDYMLQTLFNNITLPPSFNLCTFLKRTTTKTFFIYEKLFPSSFKGWLKIACDNNKLNHISKYDGDEDELNTVAIHAATTCNYFSLKSLLEVGANSYLFRDDIKSLCSEEIINLLYK